MLASPGVTPLGSDYDTKSIVDQQQTRCGGDPAGPPPGVLRLKFENVEIEAGAGASLDLHYGGNNLGPLILPYPTVLMT